MPLGEDGGVGGCLSTVIYTWDCTKHKRTIQYIYKRYINVK